MLIDFFLKLKNAKVPVTTKEYLMLIEGMQKGVVGSSIDNFYYFSRTCLVCCSIPGPASSPVAGTSAICPAV